MTSPHTTSALEPTDPLGIVAVLATMSLVRNVATGVNGAYARHLPSFLAQHAMQGA